MRSEFQGLRVAPLSSDSVKATVPNSGVFVLVSSVPHVDFPIPGEGFSFGTLELAQAVGDFQSLDATGRRALHIHLPDPTPDLLQGSLSSLLEHLAVTGT